MNKLMKRFLIRSVILTFVFLILGGLLYVLLVPQYYQNIFLPILFFFLLTTNLVHLYLLRIAENDLPKFTNRFMMISTLKMLFYLMVAIIYILANRDQAKLFIINYLLAYVGFTILEIAEISRVVKLKN